MTDYWIDFKCLLVGGYIGNGGLITSADSPEQAVINSTLLQDDTVLEITAIYKATEWSNDGKTIR